MKFYLCALLLAPLLASSQLKQDQEKSKLEAFSEKSGKLIQKTFIDIGKVRSLQVQVLTLEDVIENTKVTGIRFEAYLSTGYSADTKVAFIDKDEIDGLLKTLTYFRDKVFGTSPVNYTEILFTSRTGLSATAFQDNKKTWSVAFKLEKYDSKSTIYLKESEVSELIALIEKAKEKI